MRFSERALLVTDMVRALLVLALICLNFSAHALAYDGKLQPHIAAVDCTQDQPGDHSGHLPCHACRIGFDLALPPAPSGSAPVLFATRPVHYTPLVASVTFEILDRLSQPRGPPAA